MSKSINKPATKPTGAVSKPDLRRTNAPKRQPSDPAKEIPALRKESSDKQTAITRRAVPVKPESYVVRKRIELKSTPTEVWDALTNPAKTKKYFFNCEVLSDWKVGSPIIFRGRMLLVFKVELKGQIVKADPGKLLKYTMKNEKKGDMPASTSTITDTLTYSNGITTLSISDDVGNGEGAGKRYNKSMDGWDKVLSGLKKLLEGPTLKQ